MKKIFISLFVFVLAFVSIFFCFDRGRIINVKADSGFDSSYDSGGSYDSGSSYDYGSSYDSDYGYSSGSSGFSSFGVTLIIVTIIIIVIVYNLKNKGTYNIDALLSLDHTKEVPDDEVKKYIPNFKKEEFLQNRYLDYLEIQRCWTDFDTETLRGILTDELYNQYEMQLDTLKVKNQKNVMKEFVYKDAMITGITSENNQITVTIELITSFYDYIEQNGNIVRGSGARKITQHYEMTFVCNLTEKLDKCPNCGAKLDSSASKKCEYCGSVISKVSDKWVLSKKESKRQG